MPSRWLSQYSLWNGGSVASCWVTWYCTWVSDRRSSASLGLVSCMLVRDLLGIVHHLHRLEVPRLTGGHQLVRRVRHCAAGVADSRGHDTGDLVEGALHGPEAAAREGRGVE